MIRIIRFIKFWKRSLSYTFSSGALKGDIISTVNDEESAWLTAWHPTSLISVLSGVLLISISAMKFFGGVFTKVLLVTLVLCNCAGLRADDEVSLIEVAHRSRNWLIKSKWRYFVACLCTAHLIGMILSSTNMF